MKRILTIGLILILALSLLTACGGSDGDSDNGGGTGNNTPAGETVGRLNPPGWFVGEWETTEGGNPQAEKIKVTEHNVVVSSGKLDFSWQINNVGLEVKEITDENHYRLEYTQQDIPFSYDFTLKEDGSMVMMLFDAPIANTTYTKK